MQQLSFWDAPPEEPAKEPIHIWNPNEILVVEHYWANGDTRPKDLERLAEVLLGDLEFHKRSDGQWLFYRNISTGVADGRVLAAEQYLCTGWEFYGNFSHSGPQPPQDDDELD